MISLNDVLLAMSNIPVDDPIAEIWGRQMQGGYRIIEYTGSLPITISANGEALLDYRIYGADGGVGVATENLFNAQGTDNYGYYVFSSGRYVDDRNYKYWRIPVKEGDIIRWTTNQAGWGCYFLNGVFRGGFYTDSTPFTVPARVDEVTSNFNSLAWDSAMVTKNQPIPESYIPYGYKLPMTVQSENLFDKNTAIDGYEINESGIASNRLWCVSDFIPVVSGGRYIGDFNTGNAILEYRSKTENGMFRSGLRNGLVMYDTTNFIKINCPIANKKIASVVQLKATPPVYIGENQLSEDEYVSYGEQKIYRDVSGTLTPTDPPVPLPEIPTIDGTTVIDYDGDPKPSQMYVKYKGEGDST